MANFEQYYFATIGSGSWPYGPGEEQPTLPSCFFLMDRKKRIKVVLMESYTQEDLPDIYYYFGYTPRDYDHIIVGWHVQPGSHFETIFANQFLVGQLNAIEMYYYTQTVDSPENSEITFDGDFWRVNGSGFIVYSPVGEAP